MEYIEALKFTEVLASIAIAQGEDSNLKVSEYTEILCNAIYYRLPMEPLRILKRYFCPTCHKRLKNKHPHCWNCGQKLNWYEDKNK